MRSRDGLRSLQYRWQRGSAGGLVWRWRFWGGSRGQDTVSTAPHAPSTEAPEGWATRVSGEVGRWATSDERRVASWCPRRSGHGQSGLSSSAGPWHEMGQGAELVPEYELEREREKTLRQY